MSRRKSFKILTIGGWINRILQVGNNLLLIPLYLSQIGAEKYGYWLATGGVLAWAGAFDFGIAGMVKQRCAFYLGKKDVDLAVRYFQSGLVLYGALTIVTFAVIIGLSCVLNPLLNFPEEDVQLYQQAFIVAGAALMLSILKNVFASYLHALQKPAGDVLASAIGVVVNLFSVLYLLLWTSAGLWAIPIGLFLNHLCSVLVIVYFVFFQSNGLRSKWSFQREVFCDYFSISPVLFFSRLGSQIVLKVEPTFIVMFLTPELATMFTVAKRLVEVMIGFTNTVRGAMLAGYTHYFGEKGREETTRLLDRVLQITLAMSFAITVVYLATNGAFVAWWVGPELYIGMFVCGFIGLDAMINSVANTVIDLVGAAGEMRRSSLAMFFESALRVSLMLILLPLVGIWGLPMAATFGGTAKLFYGLHRLWSQMGHVQLQMNRPLLMVPVLIVLLYLSYIAGGFLSGRKHLLMIGALALSFGAFASSAVAAAFPYVRLEAGAALGRIGFFRYGIRFNSKR